MKLLMVKLAIGMEQRLFKVELQMRKPRGSEISISLGPSAIKSINDIHGVTLASIN